MLCYRCGTHAPDTAEVCPTCGQKLTGSGLRQATGTFSRRRPNTGAIEGAPYKPQDLVASRYLIKDIVGAGPLGFVFRAHDKEIDVEVALKVINPKMVQSPEERKQFAKELRLARKLSHPNLVRVYEEGEDQDRPFFTSQFLDGLTLRKIIDLRLQKGQFFALHEIEPILAQVCAALDGAHKVGPHSDVKPENILVLPDLLKVTDFGLGLAMPRLPFVQAMKARKADRYLSPELVEGTEIDGRADVYAVGVIIGEMLAGVTPDGSIPELSRRNPEVTVPVEGMYRRAVNANPLSRFKTPGELIAELSEQARKSAPTAPPPKVESATGVPPPIRPRTTTGMMQLQPRRDKPPPPVAATMPPPPPPGTGEVPMPDATQPVDPSMLKNALDALPTKGRLEPKENREPTEVIDSGQLIQSSSADEEVDTRVGVETTPAPPAPGSSKMTWVWVSLLVLLGIGLGAGGGYYWIQKSRRPVEPPKPEKTIDQIAAERIAAEEARQAAIKAAEKAAADKLAAQKGQTPQGPPEVAVDVEAQKAAAAKAAAEKAAADQAAADKAAAEKAAADKAAADKAAADKAAADKAAADKAAKEKLAGVTPAIGTTPPAGGTCPEGMRLVAAGAFRMGTPKDDPMLGFEDKGLSAVTTGAFCVDAFEYPNKKGTAPTVSVTFADAERLCQSAGKRLCTEAEWEKSCKGGGSLKWTYGNAFDANACNTEDDSGEARSLASAGRFARCRSSYGAYDMSGNVAEWTAERVVKGGSYATSDYGVRCAARKASGVSKSSEVGFRCCSEAH